MSAVGNHQWQADMNILTYVSLILTNISLILTSYAIDWHLYGIITAIGINNTMLYLHGDNVMRDKKLIIGLCDDEEMVHVRIERMLGKYQGRITGEVEVKHFYSGIELLGFEGELDALLLDIDMPQMDGIEAAHQLSKRGIEYRVIMLTGKAERFKEAFEIGAFRFVTKPVMEGELFCAIDDVQERMLGLGEITLYKNRVKVKIEQRDIYYIMADGTQTVVCVKNGDYRSSKSLGQWEQELEEKLFIRAHRSYIVNLAKIEKFEAGIILVSGEKIPVGRRRRRELKQDYIRFDTRYR